jgi:hypothetical protein
MLTRQARWQHTRTTGLRGARHMARSQTYEITFTGQAGSTLRAEFDDCQVSLGSSTTTLRAELPDQGALTGLVARITGLGLEVVDLHLVAQPRR